MRLTELDGCSRRDAVMVDPRVVRVESGFNVRDFDSPENKLHVETLATSIAEVGVLNPIVVRYEADQVWLVDGESRLRATLLAIERGADIQKIQGVTEVVKGDEASRVASLMTRNQGKPLTPMEQSAVISRLAGFGWSEEEIARKTNISVAYVAGLLKLNAAPTRVKKMVQSGKVSATLAIQAVRDHGDGAYDVLKKAVEHAETSGKGHATAKDVRKTGGHVEKPQRNVPLYYQRTQVKGFIDQLVEIAADTAMPRGLRNRIKNARENADVNYRTWGQEMV